MPRPYGRPAAGVNDGKPLHEMTGNALDADRTLRRPHEAVDRDAIVAFIPPRGHYRHCTPVAGPNEAGDERAIRQLTRELVEAPRGMASRREGRGPVVATASA
jgi:hypothetical protein